MNYIEIFGQLISNIIIKLWDFATSLFFYWTSVFLTSFILLLLFLNKNLKYILIKNCEKSINNIQNQNNKKINLINIISVIMAIGVLAWSIHTYQQLLPLSQSNVVLTEENIKIFHGPCLGEEKTICDYIEPKIKNTGKSEAKNIKFRIYKIYFDNFLEEDKETHKTQDITIEREFNFDNYSLNYIPSESEISFGVIIIQQSRIDTNDNVVNFLGRNVGLIYHLEYLDSITNKKMDNYYFYKHTVGADSIYTLIKEDFNKISEKLLNYLEKETEKDILLINHIKAILNI